MPASTRTPELRLQARELRNAMTDAERHLWLRLRGRQLAGIKFRRQLTIGPCIVDFVGLQHKLIIELDGGQHATRLAYDTQRTAFLQAQGYRVLRFWNHEVLQQVDAVLESVMRGLWEDSMTTGGLARRFLQDEKTALAGAVFSFWRGTQAGNASCVLLLTPACQ